MSIENHISPEQVDTFDQLVDAVIKTGFPVGRVTGTHQVRVVAHGRPYNCFQNFSVKIAAKDGFFFTTLPRDQSGTLKNQHLFVAFFKDPNSAHSFSEALRNFKGRDFSFDDATVVPPASGMPLPPFSPPAP